MALAARRRGISRLYVPADNALESSFAHGINVYPVPNVKALIDHLNGTEPISPVSPPEVIPGKRRPWTFPR